VATVRIRTFPGGWCRAVAAITALAAIVPEIAPLASDADQIRRWGRRSGHLRGLCHGMLLSKGTRRRHGSDPASAVVAGRRSAYITGKDRQGLTVLVSGRAGPSEHWGRIAAAGAAPGRVGANTPGRLVRNHRGVQSGQRRGLTHTRLATISGSTPWSAFAG
jgi:hypothetical protein